MLYSLLSSSNQISKMTLGKLLEEVSLPLPRYTHACSLSLLVVSTLELDASFVNISCLLGASCI